MLINIFISFVVLCHFALNIVAVLSLLNNQLFEKKKINSQLFTLNEINASLKKENHERKSFDLPSNNQKIYKFISLTISSFVFLSFKFMDLSICVFFDIFFSSNLFFFK